MKASHITDCKNVIPLLLIPFYILIEFDCSSILTLVSPLSLFINRDLRVGVYDGIIISEKSYASNPILSIGDHFAAIDLRTGAIEN